jgi:predicted ATPase
MSLSLATRRQRENILKGVLETAGDQPVSLITKASIIAGKDRRTGHQEFSHALLAAVDRRPDVELQSTLDRLIGAGLLFSQGVSPYATYLFKHALVQDAAYGTLLRDQPRSLHARIAETLEGQFAEISQSQPELVARHCSEAGLIEKAVVLWGKAGQRSLERSALVEGMA